MRDEYMAYQKQEEERQKRLKAELVQQEAATKARIAREMKGDCLF